MYTNHYELTIVTDTYSLDGRQLRDILREALEQYEGGCCIECVRTEPGEDTAPVPSDPSDPSDVSDTSGMDDPYDPTGMDAALQAIDADADAGASCCPQALEHADAEREAQYSYVLQFLRTLKGEKINLKQLQRLSRLQGISQRKLALAIGVDPSCYNKTVLGRRVYPYIIQRIRQYTGATIITEEE